MPEECRREVLPPSNSFLKQIREKELEVRTTAGMAHSGTISKLHQKKKGRRWSRKEQMRLEMILIFLQQLCSVDDVDLDEDHARQCKITLVSSLNLMLYCNRR